MRAFKATVDRVIDGDTVDLVIDLGFDVSIRERVRLGPGFDAWESRHRNKEHKAKGLKAKEFVEEKLPVGSEVELFSKEYSRGKYGRVLGNIHFERKGYGTLSLIEELKRNGHEKTK